MSRTKLLSTAMAAEKLGFSQDYVRRLCGQGKIKATKLANDWLIAEGDLRNICRQRKNKTASPELESQDNDNGSSEQ